ncbi:MAG: hypothetical protein AB7I48_29110 [Planctomycetaceae bacterium]
MATVPAMEFDTARSPAVALPRVEVVRLSETFPVWVALTPP